MKVAVRVVRTLTDGTSETIERVVDLEPGVRYPFGAGTADGSLMAEVWLDGTLEGAAA